MSTNIPNWIQCSPHISTLRTLASRERQRDGIRTVSRHRSHQLAAATSLQNTELVDHYSVTAGCKNQYGNRYMDIEPYDRTRVVVGVEEEQRVTGASDAPNSQGRYLNASWVRELFGGKWWIATQAPLPTTAHTFLSLLLQPLTRPPQSLDPSTSTSPTCRIRTVVQLTQNVENGRQKAYAYFPYVDGQAWIVPSDPGSSTPSIKVTAGDTTYTRNSRHSEHGVDCPDLVRGSRASTYNFPPHSVHCLARPRCPSTGGPGQLAGTNSSDRSDQQGYFLPASQQRLTS